MIKNFKTFNLACELYHECYKLKLPGHLKEQLLRSTSSVALNLSEGSGKRTDNDKRRFFYIAMGSLRESEAIILLAKVQDIKILKLLDKTGAHLYNLLKYYE